MFENAKQEYSIAFISTNFKLFKYFSMSSSTNINHTWSFNSIEKSFDILNQEVVTTDLKGFDFTLPTTSVAV